MLLQIVSIENVSIVNIFRSNDVGTVVGIVIGNVTNVLVVILA